MSKSITFFIATAVLAQAALGACAVEVGSSSDPDVALSEQEVVYGAYDWREYTDFAAASPVRRWADATGFMLHTQGLYCLSGICTVLTSETIYNYNDAGDDLPICDDEVLGTAESAITGQCTVALVGPQLVATAGHCFSDTTAQDCSNQRVVFGYHAKSGYEADIPESDVYSCTQVIARTTTTPEYALFKLDRPVTGRVPLWIRRSGDPVTGKALTALGHPAKVSLKIDQGASIKVVTANEIGTNPDTAKGSSGGPMIDTATGVVEGLHVTAPLNAFWVWDSGTPNACLRWFECEDGAGCPQFDGATRTSTFQSQVPLHPAGIAAVVLS